MGFLTTLIKNYSSLKLSDLVDDLDTTDRLTARATVAAQRGDGAIVVDAQAVRAATVRRSRPKVASVTNIVETAIVAVARTRSRIPDRRGRTEFAGKVHAFA